jgi:hypothetical protein
MGEDLGKETEKAPNPSSLMLKLIFSLARVGWQGDEPLIEQ